MRNTHTISRSFIALMSLCLILIAGLFVGCSDSDPSGPSGTPDFSSILNDFVDYVVVATYADLRDESVALNAAVAAFVSDPSSQAKLNAAADAWVLTRRPWEASEAFLFGPAAFLSLDPSLDSWPVDRQQLDDILASSLALDQSAVDLLGPSVRGFHTIEYLLFRDGQPRDVATVTAREREYLAAVAAILADDAEALWSGWAVGYDGGPAFGEEMKRAGMSGSRYVSQTDAVLEVIEGMVAICDEVANGKIGDPFNEQDVTLVESQFSFISLDDFQNNLRSVRSGFTGGYHLGSDGIGLDDFVAGLDASLRDDLVAKMDASIKAIAAIPAPFRDNLSQSSDISAAVDEINALLHMLEEDLKPLVSNES